MGIACMDQRNKRDKMKATLHIIFTSTLTGYDREHTETKTSGLVVNSGACLALQLSTAGSPNTC